MHSASNSDSFPVNTSRRRFIRTTTGGIVLAASSTTFLQGCSLISATPDSAIAAWQPSPLADDVVRWALSYAILAPNPHNLQPWLIDLSNPDEILISIDPERLLPETDPFGRQILIGTGAMLGLFELAMMQQGFEVQAQWIASTLEESSDAPLSVARPLLRVSYRKANKLTSKNNNHLLFKQIQHRHTDRSNYDLQRPPTSEFVTSVLTHNSQSQNVNVLDRTLNTDSFQKIAQWVKQAWEIELATPATAMESIKLLRIGRHEIEKHRDGIVIDNPFLVILDKLGLFDREKPLPPGSRNYIRQIAQFNDSIDSTPAWFYLTSDSNTRMSQIEAGRTYALVQLRATELGMVMHPVSQGLQEYPQMNDIRQKMTRHIQTQIKKKGITIQMLARVGYLPDNAAKTKPSPRRGLDAHLFA